MGLYADIIIDITRGNLDRTFQYAIPVALEGKVRPGVIAGVPFGRGKRIAKGYVVDVSDEPKIDVTCIKEIEYVSEDSFAVESQLIALASWMKKTYGGTMNQALKTVMPVKRRAQAANVRRIKLKLSISEARDILFELERKHQSARARLLSALIKTPEMSYADAAALPGISAKVIRAMEDKGVLEVEETRSWRNPLSGMLRAGSTVTLSDMQQKTADDILDGWRNSDKRPCLIHGATGSGKTEVYMELIRRAADMGKQSIVLIPEISLTYQTVSRFYSYFGDRVSVINSRMSAGERSDQFERAASGDLDVMIGPRSALFTPFKELGFIIIDEEHEGSYISENVPRYHARETAAKRAELSGALLVLGSATPSVSSYKNALEGRYRLFEIKSRPGGRPMPRVHVADMRLEMKKGNRSILSDILREKIEERLDKGEQTMLFLNRRGAWGFVSCRSCGLVIKCPHCDVTLSLHGEGEGTDGATKKEKDKGNGSFGILICHYCGYKRPMPGQCPSCSSPYIGGFKAGTQKVEEYIKKEFPKARVLRMDMDTTRKKNGHEKITASFAAHEADILIGTQMIVKGHDFKDVTLVAALAADMSLNIPDYAAGERTFELLEQAAGRAGRGERWGEAVIQTYDPEHYSIQAVVSHDYRSFYDQEIAFRCLMRYPPVWHMLTVHMLCPDKEKIDAGARLIKEDVIGVIKKREGAQKERFADDGGAQVIGPADETISRVRDIFRKVIYVKTQDAGDITAIKDALEARRLEDTDISDIIIQFDMS